METLHEKLGLFDDEKVLDTKEATFEIFSDNPNDDADVAVFIENCHKSFYEEKLDQISYLQGFGTEKPEQTKKLVVEIKVHLVDYNND